MSTRSMLGKLAVALLLWCAVVAPAVLDAQVDRVLPLKPGLAAGRENVVPFMEGWYANEDGTYTIAFGYLNQSRAVVEIAKLQDHLPTPT